MIKVPDQFQPKQLTMQKLSMFTGWLTVEVDELREMLGMPDSYRWVHISATLDKVTKELMEKAHIHLQITRKKTSRRITHLKIEFIEAKPEA